MNDKEKKVSIFLDTNIFQTIWGTKSNKNVYLDKVAAPSDYYKLIEFISANRLDEHIEICIPSVVVMEYKQHMLNCYEKNIIKIQEDIAEYRKTFGSIVEIEYSLKIKSEEYLGYVDQLLQEFVDNPRNRCKVVQHTRNQQLIDTLLAKALSGTKPFFAGAIGGKNHSDAGFKDSIIAETIYEYCRSNDRIGVLISQDNDFADPFESRLSMESKFVQFNSIQSAVQDLVEFFETDPVQRLKKEFTRNTYLHECLLREAGIKLDDSVTERVVRNVSIVDNNIFKIEMDFVVNETKYHYTVEFDTVANQITDCIYELEDD